MPDRLDFSPSPRPRPWTGIATRFGVGPVCRSATALDRIQFRRVPGQTFEVDPGVAMHVLANEQLLKALK